MVRKGSESYIQQFITSLAEDFEEERNLQAPNSGKRQIFPTLSPEELATFFKESGYVVFWKDHG